MSRHPSGPHANDGAAAAHRLRRADLALEQRSIVELCRETLSIAEVSARLGIPINVVKILVGDLVDAGLVVPDQAGGWPAPEGSDRVSTSARISASG